MNDTAIADVAQDGAAEALLGGFVRKRLGLKDSDIGLGLALAGKTLGRHPREALKLYAALILCDPSNLDCQIGLSNCALAAGEPHLAVQAASVVIALDPADPRGHILSAQASIALGDLADAREDVGFALETARRKGDAAMIAEAERLAGIVELMTR